MGDSGAADVAAAQAEPPVTRGPRRGGRLAVAVGPGAQRGAERAIESGADLLVFLDVDCIPAPGMVQRYVDCARRGPMHRDCCADRSRTCLRRRPAATTSTGSASWPTRIRPAPARPTTETLRDGDPRLFWSLSFAVRPEVWERIGGFCEEYCGYGGEDTDFGQCAAAAGVRLDWTGGAHAYHQFHPAGDPPVEHLDDILANAQVFFRRWGWWPMPGWLSEFQRLGLAYFDPADGWRRGSRGDG